MERRTSAVKIEQTDSTFIKSRQLARIVRCYIIGLFIFQTFTPTCTEGVFTSTSKHYFTGYQIYVKIFNSIHWENMNIGGK